MKVLGHLKLIIDNIIAIGPRYQGRPLDQDISADWVANSTTTSARSDTPIVTLTSSKHYLHGHTPHDEKDTDSERRNPHSVKKRLEVRPDLSVQGQLDVQSKR